MQTRAPQKPPSPWQCQEEDLLRLHPPALKSFSARSQARLSPHSLRSQQCLSEADPARSPRPPVRLPRGGSRLFVPVPPRGKEVGDKQMGGPGVHSPKGMCL